MFCDPARIRVAARDARKAIEAGERLISDQKACQLVTNKAVEISSVIKYKINLINYRITSDVQIASNVDIYNPKAEEVLLFDDGDRFIYFYESTPYR